jgi:predicted nucleic acid-binding protein
MIARGEKAFVDTGAWIAMAVVRDAFHERAVAAWRTLDRAAARLYTSVPVVLETFTYLDRKGSRDLALRWRASLRTIARFQVVGCQPAELEAAWSWLDRRELYRLGLVDATSFVIMGKHGIRVAFAFDVHFATAGFRLVE